MEAAVVDLLASWGATEHPDLAPLLQVISERPSVSVALRLLQQKGRHLLPPDLQEELDEAVAILHTSGSLGARSFRTRLDRLLARAEQVLRAHGDERRGALAAQLRSWGLLLPPDELSLALQQLWRAEHPSGVTELLAANDGLDRIQETLETVRESMASDMRLFSGEGAQGGADAQTLERAHSAMQTGDPVELLWAKHVVDGVRAREGQRSILEACREAHDHLLETCQQGHKRLQTLGSDTGGGAARMLRQCLENAERLLEASASSVPGAGVLQPALISWERTLRNILEGDLSPGQGARKAREDLAQGLMALFNKQSTVLGGTNEALGGLLQEATTAATTLHETAPVGGPEFQRAFDTAAALLRRADAHVASLLEEAAGRLRKAEQDLRTLLDKVAEYIPTSRVLEARLHLDLVNGTVVAGDLATIESLERTIGEDLESLRRLAKQEKRRRTNRMEATRDALVSEVTQLLEVAPRWASWRLRALMAAVKSGDGKSLARMRSRLDRLAEDVERTVRRKAGNVRHAARLRVEKMERKSRPNDAEKVKGLRRSIESLSVAMEKEDLTLIRGQTTEAASILHAVAPFTRPLLRATIVGALLIVSASAFFAWRHMADPTHAVVLRLAGSPAQTVSIWLVEGGQIVHRGEYGIDDDSISFRVLRGHYEVFVDEQYTGRVVRVPEETELKDISIPRKVP